RRRPVSHDPGGQPRLVATGIANRPQEPAGEGDFLTDIGDPRREKNRAEEISLRRTQPGLRQWRKAADCVLAEDPGDLPLDLHPAPTPGFGMVPEIVEGHRAH